MKRNLFSSMRMPLSGLLLGSITLFSSCSKEQDAVPVETPTAVATQANALRIEGTVTQGATAYFRYDSGGYFYGAGMSHYEVANKVRLEFWTVGTRLAPARLVFVARDAHRFIADQISGNAARYFGVDFTIPLLVPAGQYTLVLRTQVDHESLMIATTGEPDTYVHSLSTAITINPKSTTVGPPAVSSVPPLLEEPFYFSHTLRWDPSKFDSNDDDLRAFARSESTGTIYQLTSANQQDSHGFFDLGYSFAESIVNDGEDNIVLNEANKPEFLPAGVYTLSLDNFFTKVITLHRITVEQ